MKTTSWKLGSELSPAVRRDCLARYVHRFTAELTPDWARSLKPDGTPHAVQYASDIEWLNSTRFCVNSDGTLNCRVTHCESGKPTWPNNPELRTVKVN